ncbi:hypothetical protein D7316_00040 [Gordonia insulae]|uniref:Uncharacterized protein n=2 Tax=Gordonia insulae TaxID=2420509 RepID=A0A3G8JFU8_9ACTN|nr:hypothetical protein D7316_00040 [Gordonia insulae]
MTATHFDLDDERADRLAEQRERREAERALTQAFEPVDELPRVRTGYGAKPIPAARLALIDYCRSHPGKWVKYTPTPEQDPVRVGSIGQMIRKQQGGFGSGFESTIRAKIAYIRFTGGAA